MSQQSSHFLKNIEIKHFKGFDNFSAAGFNRVNLITGKNNVGKTAFMEACYINIHSQNVAMMTGALASVKFMRENLNILQGSEQDDVRAFIENADGLKVDSNLNAVSFKIENKRGVKTYRFHFSDEEIRVNVNEFSFEENFISNVRFIDNFGLSNVEIINSFTYVQKSDQEPFLDEVLNNFDKNIAGFKIFDGKPHCKVNGQYLEITELGDGVRHLVSIIVTLFRTQNGYLLIDEMDNGIHYTKLDELWEVILKTSKTLNVQIFATTHSKECLNSFARVAKKLKERDISLIELGKNQDKIESIVFDYDGLMHQIEQKLEVRGW